MTTALVDRVRIAFTTDPFSASPTWTDVSTDVQLYSGITVTRGKGDRYGQIQPGTISLTLDNPTGAYTPSYAAGANFPNVVIGKRIQWHSSIDNGVNWFPRFDGFIDTWQTSWDTINGSWASCVVQATDRTKFMARQFFLDTLLETVITTPGPVDYWPLDDEAETVHPKNRTGTTVLAPFSTTDPAQIVTFGVDGLPYEGTTAVQTVLTSLKASGATTIYSGAFTLMAFVKFPNPNPLYNYTAVLLFDEPASNFISLSVVGATGSASFQISDPSIAQTQTGTPASGTMLDGQWHGIAGTYTPSVAGGRMDLYIDGVDVGAVTGLGSLGTTYTLWSIAGNFNGAAPPMIQAHTALFTLDYDMAVMHGAGLTGFTGDTSFSRATRIASFASITPTAVGTSGTQSMGPLTEVGGKSLDQLLQDVQATENGAIFFGVDGALKAVSRRNFDNPTVAITLPTGSYEADLQHVTDDSQLVNVVSATGSTGNRQTATNTALAYLGTVNPGNVTLNTTSDPEALGYAQRRLVDGDPNNPRFDTVSLDLISMIPVTTPYNGVTVITAFWNSDIGSVLQCTGLPTGSAPSASMTQQIQGYTETRTHDSYSVKFNTTPTFMNVWILQDATYGVLNSTTVLAY